MKDTPDPESVSAVLLGSIWAGLGALFIGAVLFGAIYLFMPGFRSVIEKHLPYIFVGAIALFIAGAGISLQSALELQFLRGKWK